jgi:hypothetical protein
MEHDGNCDDKGSHIMAFMSEGDTIDIKNELFTPSELHVKMIEVEVSHIVSHCACGHVCPCLCLFLHLM